MLFKMINTTFVYLINKRLWVSCHACNRTILDRCPSQYEHIYSNVPQFGKKNIAINGSHFQLCFCQHSMTADDVVTVDDVTFK